MTAALLDSRADASPASRGAPAHLVHFYEDEQNLAAAVAKFLGAGVASIINVLNPEMVVIAGGVTRAGDTLFEPLRAEVRRRAFKSAQECCRIVPAELPGTAGVVGAAGVFKLENYGAV